jgi:thiol-disulfide isomerase/thioredoxin
MGITWFLVACTPPQTTVTSLLVENDASQAMGRGGSPAGGETEEAVIVQSDLPVLYAAPELENEVWLNVDHPLRLADLRGKVVAIEMWTFGCINCQHVIPSLKELHSSYADQGLVIIGNHYPEFTYETDLDNLKAAIAQWDIQYAVAQDNDGKTWRAYHNRWWPSLYLIDKWGNVRFNHHGEGRYAEIDAAVRSLLAETYP